MKVLNLWVDGEGWTSFSYNNIEDIKTELSLRNISIGDGASIGSRASIGDGATPMIIQFIGSKNTVKYWGEDRIDIGYKEQSINEWIAFFNAIGDDQGYNDLQKKEYKKYVDFINEIHHEANA